MPADPPRGLTPLRILVREVNWLGDAVMTTPALQRLREQYPKAHIALLCPKKLTAIWLHFPCVDEVLSLQPGQTPWAVGRRLRAAGFDTALVFPNSPRAALEAWFARIPRRIGYAQRWRNWCLTQAVAPRPGRRAMRKKSAGEIHELIRTGQSASPASQDRLKSDAFGSHQLNEYLHLTAQLGASPQPIRPFLSIEPDETRAAASKFGLDDPALATKPILALNPGAEYGPAKRWPVASFIAAAAQIQQRTDCVLLILGGRQDVALANEIHSALRTAHSALKNLTGKTSLRELMALLKLTRVLLTNDTGPMHLAAALGTPVVVPFGSTSPELTAPGLPGDSRHYLLASNVPCAPCFRRTCPIDFRCMRAISVESVVAAVLEAFALAPDAIQRQK
jgi:heptosyltransferase-2